MDKLKPVVHELFSQGLEDKETALGFHGTSWEAIEELLRTGALPPSSSKNLKGVTHAAGVEVELAPGYTPRKDDNPTIEHIEEALRRELEISPDFPVKIAQRK